MDNSFCVFLQRLILGSPFILMLPAPFTIDSKDGKNSE